MSVSRHMGPESDTVRLEAERWFARRRDGVRLPDEEAKFRQWVERSDAHAAAYAASERTWCELEGLRESQRMREIAAAAMRATAPTQKVGKSSWKPLLLAAGVAAVAVLGVVQALLHTGPVAPAVYSTLLGEQRNEQLADGTRVLLNTETVLQVRYGDKRREIVLEQGEAIFEVTHDPSRPFTVRVADGVVTALGTRFQVRTHEGAIAVTLLDGSVSILRDRHDVPRYLVPGDLAEYRAAQAGITVRKVDPVSVTAWTQRRLDFRATPLSEVVAEANRYSARKLRLAESSLAGLLISGNFRAGDNLGIAVAISAAFPVRIVAEGDDEIVLQAN